jgi:transcriptional regulator with XRE-family HTH domain
VPPSDNTIEESCHSLVIRLRICTGLTQRELASRVAVNVSSIQGWEAGDNYPGVTSLKALIAAGLTSGGFTGDESKKMWLRFGRRLCATRRVSGRPSTVPGSSRFLPDEFSPLTTASGATTPRQRRCPS